MIAHPRGSCEGFVRLRDGVPAAAALAGLQHIASIADRAFAAVPRGGGAGDTVSVDGVQRPAEIVNYRTIGATPALLASALAAGAILALGLTLAASVRRRRKRCPHDHGTGLASRVRGPAED